MKKVFITSIALLLSLAASAAVQIDGLWYNLNSSNKTAEVVASQGTKYSGDISIPYYVYYGNTSYTVTSIGLSAFEKCTDLNSVTIPSTIKTLDQGAFYKCSNLICVKIPEGVTKIGLGAFSKCSKLTSVIIPSTVTQIDEYAFDYCTSLSHIVSGIQQPNTIKSNVFDTHSSTYSVYSQATLVVPDGSKSAYKSKTAWNTFTNIKEASEQKVRTIHVAKAGTLPDYISDIEKYKIEELTITGELNGTDIRLIRDMAGSISYGRSHGSFVNYVSTDGKLKSLNLAGANIVKGGGGYITVPWDGGFTCTEDCYDDLYTSDNTISHLLFYLTKLESIVIPKSVTSIASDAFNNCPSLNSLKVESGNPYYDSRNNCNAIIEKSSNVLIAGCKTTIVPNGVTEIGANAFNGCSGLTSITIPNSVTSIGESAFNGCSSLTSIMISNSVTSIGAHAFYGCSGLTTIVSEIENPFAISENVFYCSDKDIYATATLIVPVGKKSVYQSKDGWSRFQKIVEVGEGGVINCEFETDGIRYGICMNNTVSVIQRSEKYTGDIVIPNQVFFNGITYSVTNIGWMAFSRCDITSITIPPSITHIAEDAFRNCTSLTSVHISDLDAWLKVRVDVGSRDGGIDCSSSPLYYANHLYLNEEEVKSIEIPNTWTYIPSNYFEGWTGLTSVTIPNSVTWIGDMAFSGCSGLTSITIPNSVTSINSYTFYGCSNMTSLIIGNSLTSIYSDTFYGCVDLVRIVSHSKVPPTCGSNAFSSKAYCTLWVPKGCREAYLKANEWKDFKEIREIDGDINLDGKVNKADIDALVTYIMNGTPAIYGTIADLNDDEKVNAADVVTLIDLLNNGDLSTEFQPYFGNENGNLVVTSITCTLKNNRKEAIQLTKCELYCNNSLVSYRSYSAGSTVAAGGNNDCSFSGLSIPASSSNFTVIWHYTYNGESYSYRCDLTE